MIVVITGGTGFLGNSIGQLLVHSGYSLHVLTRDSKRAKKTLRYPAKIFEWDPIKELPPEKAFPQNESFAVINLLGHRISMSFLKEKYLKQLIYDSRILGTKHLVKRLQKLKNPPKVFISASATGIYGSQGELTLTEECDANRSRVPSFLKKVCDDWELESLKMVSFSRTVILRFGLVLSKSEGLLKTFLILARFGLLGTIYSKKPIWFGWISIEDIKQVVKKSLEEIQYIGPYNVVSPELCTFKSFIHTITKSVHRIPFPIPVPLFLVTLFGGSVAKSFFLSQKPYPERLTKQGYKFQYTNLLDFLKNEHSQ